MPRRTHPRERAKHSRSHTRHHRERVIAKRWREAKARVEASLHPEVIRRVYGAHEMMQQITWEWGTADGRVLKMPNDWSFKRLNGIYSYGFYRCSTWPFDQPQGMLADRQVMAPSRCGCYWCRASRSRYRRPRAGSEHSHWT